MDLDELKEALEGAADAVAVVHLVEGESRSSAAGVLYAVVVLKEGRHDLDALGDAVREKAAGSDRAVVPMILSAGDAAQLGKSLGEAWVVPPESVGVARILRAYARREPAPRTARKASLALVRASRDVVEQLQGDGRFPRYLALEVVAQVAEDALALLRGSLAPSGEGGEDTVSLEGELEKAGFEPRTAQLPERLRAGAGTARLLWFATAGREDRAEGSEDLVSALIAFLSRLERFLAKHFETEAERKRKRKFALVGGGVALLFFTVAVIVYVATRPSSASSVSLPAGAKVGGISGEYFAGHDFQKRVLVRSDAMINMRWPASFAPRGQADHFSVRWKGYLYLPQDGVHQICFDKDDGGRVYVGRKRIIDDWKGAIRRRACASLTAAKGWHPLKVEFWENTGGAHAILRIATNKGPMRTVPSQHLCCRK